jgi:hypothetical protein
MNYNATSRRIAEKAIKEMSTANGREVYHTVRTDLDLDVLTCYVQRRVPKARVFREMGALNNTTLIITV